MRAIAVLVLVASGVAHAETPAATFASGMQIDEQAIIDVQQFELRNAGEHRRALLGRFKSGELVVSGAVLVWCDAKRCWSSRAWLGRGEVETLGLVDLGGKPDAFPNHARTKYERALELAGKPAWPALVVRVTDRETATTGSRYGGEVTGEHRRAELFVLSLARKDTPSPVVLRELVEERWPTGAGITIAFAVGDNGQLVATEQAELERRSMCLRPKPTVVPYKLDEHRRFRRISDLGRRGCGAR